MGSINKTKKDLFLFMEDFDNSDLPDGAWQAMLQESVDNFNEEYGTNYDSHDAFLDYCQWRSKQQDK